MNWFFIAGNFRSGTTLMRLCLDSHPGIRCYDEQISYAALGGRGKSLNPELIEAATQSELLHGFKVPKFTLTLPRHWTAWDDRYSEGKCIFMLRDPRAVVASMRRLSGGRYWNQHTQAEAKQMLQSPILGGDYVNEFEALDGLKADRPIALAAIHWKACSDMYYRVQQTGRPVHGVLYEDFVTDPQSTLRGACEFLGVEFDSKVLEPHTAQHSEVKDGVAVGGSEIRPIDTDSIERWKTDLTKSRQNLVMQFAGNTAQRISAREGVGS